MKKFTPPWRDPVADPPENHSEVIVTSELGRVFSAKYSKGKWSTYTPIRCWQPLPPAGEEIVDEEPVESGKDGAEKRGSYVPPTTINPPPPKKRTVKRKTKV